MTIVWTGSGKLRKLKVTDAEVTLRVERTVQIKFSVSGEQVIESKSFTVAELE